MKKLSFSYSCLSLTCCLLPLTVLAADTGFEGRLSQEIMYDDNFRLTDEKRGTAGAILRPAVTAYYKTETYNSLLSGGLVINRYNQLSQYNAENGNISWNQLWQGIRSRFTLNSSYSERELREIAEEDTADFAAQGQQKSISISPGYSYQLTNQDVLSVNLNFTDQKYDRNNRPDSRNYTVGGNWGRQFNEKLSGQVVTSIARFTAENAELDRTTDYMQASAGIVYQLSYITKITLMAGLSRSEVENTVLAENQPVLSLTSDSSGAIYSVEVERKTETDTFSFSVSKSLSPRTTGQVVEQQVFTAGWNKPLTERNQLSLSVSWRESDAETTYSSGSASIQWRYRLTEAFLLNTRYQFRQRKSSGEDATESNMVALALQYRF